MCREKRSFFQVVDMSGNEPKTKVSFNPTMLQFVGWSVTKIIFACGVMWAIMTFAAEWQFQKSLKEFHDVAQPEIENIIDGKIYEHRIEAEKPWTERMHNLESHAQVTDQKLSDMERRQVEQGETIKSIDLNVRRILENGGG
jgi:hypothetical protein